MIGLGVVLILISVRVLFLLALEIEVADEGGEHTSSVVLSAVQMSLARQCRLWVLELDKNAEEAWDKTTLTRTGDVEVDDGTELAAFCEHFFLQDIKLTIDSELFL